ncbi:MAG TPA: copper-translocating P-type ATPase [Sphingomonas sp.]
MALERADPVLDTAPNPELVDLTRRLWLAAVLSVPLVAIAMIIPMLGWRLVGPTASSWLQFALAAPIVAWAGKPFLARGWISVRTGRLNMFTLITLGVGAAFLYSIVALLAPGLFNSGMAGHDGGAPVYFEAAGVVITLVLVGQVLELRAQAATGQAIRALLKLAPKTAHRIRPDGTDTEIALTDVHVADRLRVRPGDTIPVDGVVREGRSYVDEAMVTGEPEAVLKTADAAVVGGTINGTGSLVIEARAVGADTVLARIVAMVAQAQRSRAPIQAIADRVSAWFVPLVILIAVVTFIVWLSVGPQPRLGHALLNAIAVLVIACPCALGLATPMAIMVGTGRGARAGVLIKNAEALQAFESVDTLVIDKTGTLTQGKPALVATEASGPYSADALLILAASIEAQSEHPLAAAIVAAAKRTGQPIPPATDFASTPGEGVSGRTQTHQVSLGNAAQMRGLGIDPTPLAAASEVHRKGGEGIVLIAVDGALCGLLAVADPVRPSAKDAIAALRGTGLRIVMLTGDDRTTADAVARVVGNIDEVRAGLLPEDKARIIGEFKRAGAKVAMAGDGVNDAPALAMADVGLAMGTGTDVAIESAGITLTRGDLLAIVRARHLARATMRNIRQNLVFSFLFNGIGVPIAAGILYPFGGILLSPMLAGAAMALSSLTVVLNALRLQTVRL